MTTVYDSTGLYVNGYDDALAELIESAKSAFGKNIKTDEDSGFGMFLKLYALYWSTLGEAVQYVGDSLNPSSASGAALSSLVQINGITRTESAYSTVTLTCGANAAGTTIPVGSLVRDPDSAIVWETDEELVVAPSSTDTVSATCTTVGANEAAAETITQIDTPIFGWATVTNLAAATPGMTEETDPHLRARRQYVAERSTNVSISAVYAALTNLDGVTDVKISEPVIAQQTYLRCIVLGGSDADIAEAIFNHKAGGVPTYGASSSVYTSPITGDPYTVYFDRPSDVQLYISVNLAVDESYPSAGDTDIKAAIEAYFDTLELGDDVINSRLYTPVNETIGHKIVSILVGTTENPTEDDDIVIDIDQRAVIATNGVVVYS